MGHTICWKESCICLQRPVLLFSEKFGSDSKLRVWAQNIQASTQKSGSWQFKLIRALPGWIVLMHPENILVSSVCSLAMSLILFWRVLAWFSSCDCRDAPLWANFKTTSNSLTDQFIKLVWECFSTHLA